VPIQSPLQRAASTVDGKVTQDRETSGQVAKGQDTLDDGESKEETVGSGSLKRINSRLGGVASVELAGDLRQLSTTLAIDATYAAYEEKSVRVEA
jgi:hypothetical protein